MVAQRVLAVGDIHGCSTALRTLIEVIGPGPDDLIVTLGDYIDWGPDSRGVIDQLISLSERCRLISLMGNHEEMLLDALRSDDRLRSWLDVGGDQTLLSYPYVAGSGMIPEGHLRFVRECRDYFETDTHIFVHANYDHRMPMVSARANSPVAVSLFFSLYPHHSVYCPRTPGPNCRRGRLRFTMINKTDERPDALHRRRDHTNRRRGIGPGARPLPHSDRHLGPACKVDEEVL